ncbi:MAG TPA: metallophosphoesterase [Thermodesulfobacteriota bacterium]|nr:metallophosphoesterase [Thermodesulfobacteriota bacterium]
MRTSPRASKALMAFLVFLGTLVFLMQVAAYAASTFTIAVIPDTQNYVNETNPQPGSLSVFKAETRYLADQKDSMNLVFVTHVGDVVQHGDGTDGTAGNASWGAGTEWERARSAMDIISASGLVFGMSPGNHDYDNYSDPARGTLKGSVLWRRYFGSGSSYFAGKSWYGGASDSLPYNPGLSSFQTFQAGGRNFLHISLEMEAGDPALTWAQGVIDSHKGYATLITTHEYLSPPANEDNRGPMALPAQRIAATFLKGSHGGWNDAQGVWDKLISKNDQIFMVICGHAWTPTIAGVSKAENMRIDQNVFGHPVYQILTDYQGNTLGLDGIPDADPGGDGWLRFMEFNLEAGTIYFSTYSPTLNRYAGRNGQWTFNQHPGFSDFTLPIPYQVLNALVSLPATPTALPAPRP